MRLLKQFFILPMDDVLYHNKRLYLSTVCSKFPLWFLIAALGFNIAFAKESTVSQVIDKNAGSGKNITEDWRNFRETSVEPPKRGTSSVVVFRPLNKVKGPAVNVYIDGEYQSSLLPGAYTQAKLCPGSHRLKVAYTNILTRYKEKRNAGQKSLLDAEEIAYYEIVTDKMSKLKLNALSEADALKLIRKLPPRQHHTITRVNKPQCSEEQLDSPKERK